MPRKLNALLLLIVIFAGTVSACASSQAGKRSIVIAVAEDQPGSAEKPAADSLYAGALMAAEQMNKLGGLAGYQIVITPYADGKDAAAAGKNASAIAASEALAVIGHSTVEAVTAAAPVYRKANLPVVVASPMTRNAISGSPNTFDISYTSEQQGAYLANYAANVLKVNQAMIVFEDNSYYTALARKFENSFHGLGGSLVLKQKVGTGAQDAELQAALGKVFAVNRGVLFIATRDSISTYFVKALKNHGFGNPIIGDDNFSTPGFVESIQKENAERVRPGYFTDNIVTTRSLLPDSVNSFTSQFVRDYQARFPDVFVSNSAARGYDAALTLFRAVQLSMNQDGVLPSRTALVAALHDMDDPKTSFYGVTGPLYFTSERMAVRQPLLGVYQHGHLISAPIQYQPVLIPENVPDLEAQLKAGRIIMLDGYYVYVTHIVYTGVDLIEVHDLDQKTSLFTADFYLWFRYLPVEDDPGFTPENITFTNAKSIDSQNPVSSNTTGDGSVYKAIRVSGDFKSHFNFQAYPFDDQDLIMQFRNQDATAAFIQYIIDRPGMRYSSDEELLSHLKENGAFNSLLGWKPMLIRANQSLFSTSSTLGDPSNFDTTVSTDFSLYDLHLRIQRDSLSFIVKSLLPLLFTLVLSYITFYLPLGHSERLGVGSTALLTTAFFHLSLASSLPEIGYTVVMEYFFYASYTISALIVFLETWSVRLEKKAESEEDEKRKQEYEAKRRSLNVLGRIAYPAILLTVLVLGAFIYLGWINFNPDVQLAPQAVREILDTQAQANALTDGGPQADGVTLELASWRPEDDAQVRKLLSAFHEKNPEITVVHLPIFGDSYGDILSARLKNGQGPDMFFLHPFDRSVAGFTLDLSSLPIAKDFEESHRIPWVDADGNPFGLPYVGVVQGMYYNKDVFDKLKLEVPATWEDFLQVSEAIKQAGYIPIANSLVENEENDIFMSVAVNFIGGPQGRQRYNVEGGRCFNDAHAAAALQAIADIAPYMSPDFKEISSYTSKQRFIDQQAVMLFGGSWDVGYFEANTKFNWGVFAPPAPRGSQTYVIFQPDIAIGVNKELSPARQKAALRFLEWLMTEESLNKTLDTLPGFYPLSSQKLDPVRSLHSAEFQRLAADYPTDLRWSYSQLSVSGQVPSAGGLLQKVQYQIVDSGITAQQAADELQAGLAQWYEPAQTCKP